MLLCAIPLVPIGVRAQPSSISVPEAGAQLIQAYESVQEADRLGAPQQDLAQLSADLNIALEYYTGASKLSAEGNLTGAALDAGLSYQVSTNAKSRALALQAEAESQKTNAQVIAYSTAVIASALSTLLVMEYHRIPNFLRKRKLFRMKTGRENPSAS